MTNCCFKPNIQLTAEQLILIALQMKMMDLFCSLLSQVKVAMLEETHLTAVMYPLL